MSGFLYSPIRDRLLKTAAQGPVMGITLSKTGRRTKVGQKFRNLLTYQDALAAESLPGLAATDKENAWPKETEDVFVMRKHTDIHLYLCRYKIFQLDSDIRHFRNLKILQICCNYLTTLPPEIAELTSLVVLFVARNQLSALPESLSRLPHLKELNLSDNQLTTIPNSFRFLRTLESIDLSGNPMSELPPAIPYIASLRSLAVQRTKILHFPPDILRLVFLSDISADRQPGALELLKRASAQDCAVQCLQGSLILRRLAPVPLYEKAAQKIITSTRRLRKATPLPVLKMLLDVNECDICGNPLFTSFITIFTEAFICEKEILLRFLLCKSHPLDYANPFQSLRESLFREKEYVGDKTLPSIPFLFDASTYTREQKKLIRQQEKHLSDTHTAEVHLLLLRKLLERRGESVR